MNGFERIGIILLAIGGVLVLVGGLVWLVSRLGLAGRLPGDITIERPGFSCTIPLATSVLLSIVLTIVLNVVARCLRR
jgi:hypothetical protein